MLRTPLLPSVGLSRELGAQVTLKPELLQPTGSFKVRGAFNKALTLSPAERTAGTIAFSAGNHALAVAYAGVSLGLPVTVCMPAGAVGFKIDAVRALGASLELVEGDLVAHVMRRREELGATLIHPFDDPAVVAGTATIGREITADLPAVDTVVVPVGGGGLISGIAAAVKRHDPSIRVVGVEPDSADVVSRSLAAARPVPHPGPASLADGSLPPSPAPSTWPTSASTSMRSFASPSRRSSRPGERSSDLTKLAAEPAAAVSLAAIRSGAVSVAGGERVCLVMSGGNADFSRLGAAG